MTVNRYQTETSRNGSLQVISSFKEIYRQRKLLHIMYKFCYVSLLAQELRRILPLQLNAFS